MNHDIFYDFRLVALSALVATLASFTALDLAARIRTASGWARHAWLLAAAVAMGGGIWSMHFIGMLAFNMTGMTVTYDLGLTLLSLLLPVIVTAFGLLFAFRPGNTLLLSGLVMGLGIAAMHYTGMAAMIMGAHLEYQWEWVVASVAIAITAATVALWIARQHTNTSQRIPAAILMGIAVSGMHYTAMYGVRFTHMDSLAPQVRPEIGAVPLALWIASTTITILILGLAAATYDRHLVSRTAHESETLRQIINTSHLYQVMTTSGGIVTYANTTALDGMGAALPDILNNPVWETPWFAGTANISAAIQAAIARAAAGGPESMKLALALAGGERSFELTIRPLKDLSGKVGSLLVEATDVTARLSAEEALRQTQKMEAVGKLTGGIAHDFNNLLMAVMGSLELLRKRLPNDPQLHRFLDNAIQGARRGASLTQRMLAFARRQDLTITSIDLGKMVLGMRDLLDRSIEPSIHIETDFEPNVPRVRADLNQLELALLNLCINARDAMPDGGTITIGIRARRSAGDQAAPKFVCLSVRDTGLGMDEETLEKAKEPFFTTKGVGKGTGLGLSMVHGMAGQLGGWLSLSSRVGAGTTAEIWLPAADVAVGEAGDRTEEDRHDGASLSILLVDDDTLVLENVCGLLEDMGHHVSTERSAIDALRSLEAGQRFDLIISDHAMPAMTGFDFLQAVHEKGYCARCILASGYAELPQDGVSKAVQLRKPFDQASLRRAIYATQQAIPA